MSLSIILNRDSEALPLTLALIMTSPLTLTSPLTHGAVVVLCITICFLQSCVSPSAFCAATTLSRFGPSLFLFRLRLWPARVSRVQFVTLPLALASPWRQGPGLQGQGYRDQTKEFELL